MQPKLEKILLNNNDMITTSCNMMSGMSPESFQLMTYYCGRPASSSHAYLGDCVSEKDPCGPAFNYYDENGKPKIFTLTTVPDECTIETGLWMHYDSEGNWQLCGDDKHHHKD